jgi:hypothetical protein
LHELDAHIWPTLFLCSPEEFFVDLRYYVADMLGPVFFVGLNAPAHHIVEQPRKSTIRIEYWTLGHFVICEGCETMERFLANTHEEHNYSDAVNVAAVIEALTSIFS